MRQTDKEQIWKDAAQAAGQFIGLGVLGWWAGMLVWYQPGLAAGLLLPLYLLGYFEIIFLTFMAITVGIACYKINTTP